MNSVKKYTHVFNFRFVVNSEQGDSRTCYIEEKADVFCAMKKTMNNAFSDDSYFDYIKHVDTIEQLEFNFKSERKDLIMKKYLCKKDGEEFYIEAKNLEEAQKMCVVYIATVIEEIN